MMQSRRGENASKRNNSGGTQGKKKIVYTTFKGKSGYNIINYIKMLSSEIFVYLSNSASRVA